MKNMCVWSVKKSMKWRKKVWCIMWSWIGRMNKSWKKIKLKEEQVREIEKTKIIKKKSTAAFMNKEKYINESRWCPQKEGVTGFNGNIYMWICVLPSPYIQHTYPCVAKETGRRNTLSVTTTALVHWLDWW